MKFMLGYSPDYSTYEVRYGLLEDSRQIWFEIDLIADRNWFNKDTHKKFLEIDTYTEQWGFQTRKVPVKFQKYIAKNGYHGLVTYRGYLPERALVPGCELDEQGCVVVAEPKIL